MNRKDFIDNFDYSIFDEYIKNNKYCSTTVEQHFLIFLNEIYSEEIIKFNDLEYSSFYGYIFSDSTSHNTHFDNVLKIDLNYFYPYIHYIKFIKNEINYNIKIFLLYSLLYKYMLMNKDRKELIDYYKISRELCFAYYGFMIQNKFISTNYPSEFLNDLKSKIDVIYIDTDMLFIKNEYKIEIIDILNEIDMKYDITPIKYLMFLHKKYYAYFSKDNGNSEYKTTFKGRQSRNLKIFDAVEKTFITMYRKEKIKIFLES